MIATYWPQWRKILFALSILMAVAFALMPTILLIYQGDRIAPLENIPVANNSVSNGINNQLVSIIREPKKIAGLAQPFLQRKRTATEVAIVKEWMSKVGYDPEKKVGYRAYSDQILSDLVKNGDTIAMSVMEERAIDAGDIAKAKTYAELGIAYGSLRSIKSMAIYTEPSFSGFPIETAKAQLKESFAYLELLSIRGDSQSATLKRSISLELFEQGYGQENSLNSEDEKWIRARALELYNHYRAERIKLGLGDFDNSIPKEVTDLFGK